MDKQLPFADKNKQPPPSKSKKKPTKKQPLKVVYISNPIRYSTTASHFKALVQELTGQDAADDPANSAAAGVLDDHAELDEVPKMEEAAVDAPERSDLSFQPYDDVFLAPMMDNFPEFSPANLLYEPPPHADYVNIW